MDENVHQENAGRGNTRMCSVLFVDIEGYSKKTNAEQIVIKQEFVALWMQAIKNVPPNDIMVVDAGDGAALTALVEPEDTIRVAMILRDATLEHNKHNPPIDIRMGINFGPVQLSKDVHGKDCVVGDGINIAQRIMSFSDAGQITISRSYYDVIKPLAHKYESMFHYLGQRSDKHERHHHIYGLGESKSSGFEVKVALEGASLSKIIFISYASQNRKVAWQICELLEQQNIVCWIAPRDVRPGKPYGAEIIKAIDKADGLILVLTDDSNNSAMVQNEVERAVSKGKTIYTLRMENVTPSNELELFISSSHWIDVFNVNLKTAISLLANALNGAENNSTSMDLGREDDTSLSYGNSILSLPNKLQADKHGFDHNLYQKGSQPTPAMADVQAVGKAQSSADALPTGASSGFGIKAGIGAALTFVVGIGLWAVLSSKELAQKEYTMPQSAPPSSFSLAGPVSSIPTVPPAPSTKAAASPIVLKTTKLPAEEQQERAKSGKPKVVDSIINKASGKVVAAKEELNKGSDTCVNCPCTDLMTKLSLGIYLNEKERLIVNEKCKK